MRTRYPTLVHLGRFAKWTLAVLKRTFFGIGGVALLVVLGLFVAGALVADPLRWCFIGLASALMLLCGGVLALSYARSVLSQSFAEHRRQVSDINSRVSQINKQVLDINKQVSDVQKEVTVIKDDVFIIGYDILKEQGKLADRVSRLEIQASGASEPEQPSHETGK